MSEDRCGRSGQMFEYAIQMLSSSEVAALKTHIAACAACREEMEAVEAIVESWPIDILHPPASLWGRIARRVAEGDGDEPELLDVKPWEEPEWQQVAPGISCKLLATDMERKRVSMLVRLAPGVDYPPHRHAGVEELHLLDGELMIDDRKLYPGDYNRAEPNTIDSRVWSETGCTCVLIACTADEIR